jgi:hypothetical protein
LGELSSLRPAEVWLQNGWVPLRLQKVQAVNLGFSPFVDANANPQLQQMGSPMISDKVEVSVNEANQTTADRSAASTVAGFPVQLIAARKDAPRLVVSGRHVLRMTVETGPNRMASPQSEECAGTDGGIRATF